MRLARALTSGLTPSLTFEKITIGSVLAPGPETKLEITRSSSDRVKLSSQLDARAGAMIGQRRIQKARTGPAPKSMAASSSERSAPCRPRLHRDGHVGGTERDVRDDDGGEAAMRPAKKIQHRHEQQQLGDAGDDFGHHQRRVHHAGEQQSAAEEPEAHQRDCRERARESPLRSIRRRRSSATATRHRGSDRCATAACTSCVEKPPQTLTSADALNE